MKSKIVIDDLPAGTVFYFSPYEKMVLWDLFSRKCKLSKWDDIFVLISPYENDPQGSSFIIIDSSGNLCIVDADVLLTCERTTI